MACDQARERALLLSLGLFGAPSGRDARDRDRRAAEARDAAESQPPGHGG